MAEKPFDWRPSYLAALRELPVIGHACRAAGIDRSTAWRATQSDPDFAEAERDAMEEGIDKAEKEAFRRGVVGFEEPVVHQGSLSYRMERREAPDGSAQYAPVLDPMGQPVPLTVRKYSDPLLALVLKGRRKKVYSERTEVTGADGGPLQVDEAARSARVAQLIALASKRKTEQDEFGDLA